MSLAQCNPTAKMIWHTDRLAEFDRLGKTSPILFEIDPSNKCNQDCPWCSFSKLRSESQAVMCKENMFWLLNDLRDMGVRAVSWSGGGEPLMNPFLMDAIKHADGLGLDQGIFTNGLLLKEDKARIMAKHMTWIRISLDGYDEESYAKSHGTSDKSFNIVINNIRKLVSIENRCVVGVGFIINEHNYDGIETAVKLAKKIGVDYIQLKPVANRPNQKQVSSQFVSDAYMKSLIMQEYSDDKFNVMVTHYRFEDMMNEEGNYGRNYKKCLSHHFQGAVGADAKVYLCDHHKGEKDYELGDLNKNTMKEVWNSKRRQDVIEMLDKTDLSQCQACCRNHELNKMLWRMKNKERDMHPNHI